MKVKVLKLKSENLQELLRRLMAGYEVYIPKGLGFSRMSDPAEFEPPRGNTKKPIKELFLPPCEPLVGYRLGRSIEVGDPLQEANRKDRIVFGARMPSGWSSSGGSSWRSPRMNSSRSGWRGLTS